MNIIYIYISRYRYKYNCTYHTILDIDRHIAYIYPSLPTGDLISRIWIALDDMTMDLGPLECPKQQIWMISQEADGSP